MEAAIMSLPALPTSAYNPTRALNTNDNVTTHQIDPRHELPREAASARLVGVRLERPSGLPERETLPRNGACHMAFCIPDHPCQPTVGYRLPAGSNHRPRHRPVRKDSADLAKNTPRQRLHIYGKDRKIPDHPHQQMETNNTLTFPLPAVGAQ